MRHGPIGVVLSLAVACFVLGPSRANDRKPEGGAADRAPDANSASAPGGVLEFQVVSQQTQQPLAGADLEIRIGGQCGIPAFGP